MTESRLPTPPAWHALALGETLALLQSNESGLGSSDAKARLERDGPNVLPTKAPPGFGRIFANQFRSPLIYVLAAAALVSLATSEHTDAAFIAAVLLLNAAIGAWQEFRAERGMRALQRFLQTRAVVLRDGETRELDAEELVGGDVVLLESGQRVPADLRLASANGLMVDESLLTGESLPVSKETHWLGGEKTPLADRLNCLHAGSTVIRGRARGIVVATGAATALGLVAREMLQVGGGKPPLVIRMERFTRVVAVGVLVAALLLGSIAVFIRGYDVSAAFLFVVALAVSAIPEGLPVGMTVALAVAAHRMARRSVIVRRLAAVEGLGSCTLIATDKTGTLTVNELTTREIWLPDGRRLQLTGEGFAPLGQILDGNVPVPPGSIPELTPLVRAAVLCNEAELHAKDDSWVWRGDPTDVALLAFAHKAGWTREAALERYGLVHQLPFEPERRFAASYHRDGDEVRAFVKGAPERVLSMCATAPEQALAAADQMARAGFRVLALAEGVMSGVTAGQLASVPRGLRLVGLVGMIDPLRAGAAAAVAACRGAGIEVSMITGDHPATALAIARNLTMAQSESEVATGAELEEMPESQLRSKVANSRVFARVAPQQKLQIVRAAQAAGHFVAVTGDGVNDAPALRQANIGVAMGRAGTDVAREAAELVITDDDFSSIVGGVEEGRVAYDNIRKVIYLLVSTGAAELVLAGLAVAFGTPLPLLPVQLLWLNLVTNGIQDVALAFEPGERDVMQRLPRPPHQRIFDRLMIERTVVAAVVMASVAFGLFNWLLAAGYSETAARNVLLLLMVLFENVHIGNCRSETRSAFLLSPLQTPILLFGTMAAFGVHVMAMHVAPLQSILGTAPIPLHTWAVLVALALTVLVAGELHKLTWRFRRGSGSRPASPPPVTRGPSAAASS